MAEENNEPNDTQSKPQSTESVKHVHLERKRPKLSKFDEQSEKGSKEKNAEQGKKHHSQNAHRGQARFEGQASHHSPGRP